MISFVQSAILPPKGSDMDILNRYFPKYRSLFILAVLCVALESVCDLLCPTLMAKIINQGIQQKSLDMVRYWGVRMLAITAIGAVFASARNILASKVSQSFGADLRHDLFWKTLHLSTESADHLQPGSLITRMTGDVTQATQMVNGTMRIFIKAPVTCIGSIILATILDWRLSLIVYAVVIVVSLMIILCMRASYPRFHTLQKAMDTINTRIEEYLLGIRLVKAFGTEQVEETKFAKDNDQLRDSAVKAQFPIILLSPLLTFIVGIGTVIVLYWGTHLFQANMSNAGDISAFTIYMTQMLSSLLMITNIFNIFVRTKASLERITEVMDAKEDASGTTTATNITGTIDCNHLSFSYPEGSGLPALEDISFHLGKGESLAIIGPTGSGKSTLAWLLLGLYGINKGELEFDGRDMNLYAQGEIHNAIALVPQKPMLFSGTVKENLTWGNRNAPQSLIEEAVEIADATFLYALPHGLDSMVDSGGVNLSGGQKQRISIARAIICEHPVMILDDATSALDALTEERVKRRLLDRHPRPTTILITQRCSTAMSAERILVLENGRQMGLGDHSALLEGCPVYRDIWETQNGGLHAEH